MVILDRLDYGARNIIKERWRNRSWLEVLAEQLEYEIACTSLDLDFVYPIVVGYDAKKDEFI